jgi:hypothetical protein
MLSPSKGQGQGKSRIELAESPSICEALASPQFRLEDILIGLLWEHQWSLGSLCSLSLTLHLGDPGTVASASLEGCLVTSDHQKETWCLADSTSRE